MEVRAAAAATRGIALGQRLHDRGERGPLEVAERVRAAEPLEQLVLAPFLVRDLGHELLREHVERLCRHRDPVELAPERGIEKCRPVAEIVAREREEPALRHPAHGVARAPHPLQKRRNRARRAELADEIDVADVDPELERCGGDQHLELTALQPLLGVEAHLA